MSNEFVLDCSVTMAWFFAGEATTATDTLLDRINQGGKAIVAQHWPLQVGNTLLMGERRNRSTPADSSHFLGILGALAIDTDKETGGNATSETLALARSHRLKFRHLRAPAICRPPERGHMLAIVVGQMCPHLHVGSDGLDWKAPQGQCFK